DEVIDSVTGNKPAKFLKDFAFRNLAITKQNVYLFKLGKTFNRSTMPPGFPLTIEKEDLVGKEYSFFCLPQTIFSVYLSAPTDKEDLKFLQPVLIRIENKSLIIRYTKLEKNLQSYYPANREVRKAGETNSEEDTLRQILAYFETNYNAQINDINKGVKYLWAQDWIDCHKIQYLSPFSSDMTTMNGALTFKQKYPTKYQNIILAPIGKTLWKYLLADDYFCDGFTTDPTAGQISFTKFPKHSNQVENVITTILANN
ncbi:MAG: hypothetical protein WCF67_23595, partial [Chitinophagaceae bacterium]